MELKESALATVCLTLLILAVGVLTGGFLFYSFAALAAFLFLIDYYRLIRVENEIEGNVEIKSGLSRNEVYTNGSTQLVCRLINNGQTTLRLLVDQEFDDSIRTDGVWKPIELSGGSTVYLKMLLEPTASGMFTLAPPDIVIESWLFKHSFPFGKPLHLKVQLPVGINIGRIGPANLRSKAGTGMFDATTVKGGQGPEFRAIRNYVAGDSVRRIDWARSSRMNELMVRDYEDEQSLPVFFFIDLDHTMGLDGEPTALHASVDLVSELVNKYLVSGERIGLAGFSRSKISGFLPARMGDNHLYDISGMLSSLKTVDDDDSVYRHEQDTLPYELKYLFKNSVQQGTLIDDVIGRYEANIRDDGFSRAVRSAIRYLNTPSRMVVVTNLSMGMVSLLNNARIAIYYGHKVSVVLIPHTWHDESKQAELEVQAAVYSLKANGIDAIVMYPGDEPDSVIKKGGLSSVKARVRM